VRVTFSNLGGDLLGGYDLVALNLEGDAFEPGSGVRR
jgi:hypothetical protein